MRFSVALSAALLVVALVLWVPLSAQEEAKKTDLPVKRVVMFSSGVAFYEHNGNVEGNASIDLKFNVRDINDLLKSMVLQDLGGGKVSTVSYASKEPVTRALQSFSIDLTTNPTLADLLLQVRGEQIEIEAPVKIAGTIVGVERRAVVIDKTSIVESSYLNLLTDEGLRSVALENVGKVRLANPQLDAELRQALKVLAAARSTDKKSVSLSFVGDGKRPVRVGYVQESPIWKTSYRLVLEDDKKPYLQGWAIVENTTEADWTNVDLALVAGRPISFKMDLYQPLYVNRPTVVPELYASLRPRTYDQDLEQKEEEFRLVGRRPQRPFITQIVPVIDGGKGNNADPMGMGGGMGGMGGMGGGGFFGGGGVQTGRSSMPERLLKERDQDKEEWNIASSAQSLATATDVGEMFRYNIATPVTLNRSQSAMLPIVNDSVEGEKLVIYNESQHPKHPLHGLRLTNTTNLHLMQGPITVFEDGAYAGDAQIQDLPPKSERIVSYAMDLDTEVAPGERKQSNHLVKLALAKGNAIVTHKNSRSRSYTVKNSGDKTKKALIEYPLEENWKLVAPKEPAEKTRNLYRFAVPAEPGKPATLEVKEEYIASQEVALTNWDDATIAFYQQAAEVSDAVKKALAEVVKRKAEMSRLAAQRQEWERQIQVIETEQTRIRGNLSQITKGTDLARRYEAKFTKQEDDIEQFRERVTAAVTEEAKLRTALDQYLLGLDLK
jgi:hypothetical protein